MKLRFRVGWVFWGLEFRSRAFSTSVRLLVALVEPRLVEVEEILGAVMEVVGMFGGEGVAEVSRGVVAGMEVDFWVYLTPFCIF